MYVPENEKPITNAEYTDQSASRICNQCAFVYSHLKRPVKT